MTYLTTDTELTSVADAIRAKGNTQAALAYPEGYIAAIQAIPTGGGTTAVKEKDVNYYDYDGTLLYSYTAEEFAALTAEPANPTQEGLIAEGWSYSLSSAQDYVAEHGFLDIGQHYTTPDGTTKVYITLDFGERLTFPLYLIASRAATVDWGDGSTTPVSNGSQSLTHTYSAPGSYIISLPQNATLGHTSPQQRICGASAYYMNCIQKILFGPGAGVSQSALNGANAIRHISVPKAGIKAGQYALQGMLSLAFITISATPLSSSGSFIGLLSSTGIHAVAFNEDIIIPANSQSMISSCRNLARVAFPEGMLSIYPSMVASCSALRKMALPLSLQSLGTSACQSLVSYNAPIKIPQGITSLPSSLFYGSDAIPYFELPPTLTSIGQNCFYSCGSVEILTIPPLVSTLGASAFYRMIGLKKLRFEASTPPVAQATNVFRDVPATCVISVPTGSLAAYTSAANYPSPSTYTYIEED